jgi:integral membrane protein (TIGR01906 family)
MNKKFSAALNIVLAICFTIFIMMSSIKFTLNFKPLYYFDMNYLKIEGIDNLNNDQIKSTYDYLIDYTNNKEKGNFELKYLTYSQNGAEHFKEVRDLFIKMGNLMVIAFAIFILGLAINMKKFRNYSFLKYTSISLLVIPITFMIPVVINFDALFTFLHKILFNNNYWLFDPNLDPVINILPEEFFMHCLILILAIILICSLISYILYKILYCRRKSASN